MKTITGLLLLLAIIITTSCEGPVGPPGPPGQDGRDGLDGIDAEMGTVIEVYGDFTPQNDYNLYYAFEDYDVTVYDGDAVLVYILWQQEETSGGLIDIWRLLPQTVLLNDGVLQYNYDFTTGDVQIFLEGTTDFNNLLPAETDNQIFRIAVLPAILAKDKSIDVTDFDSVMKSMNKNLNSIEKINPSSPLNE
ncbi:MAG: hypothetical protein JW761_06330 [Prolixibacteraceae bacterium]|jgi:hypothetical protein|nr:hypothetical protein [Prolixibacteraceae bacterium]